MWIGLTYNKTVWENGDPVTYTKWNTRVTERKENEQWTGRYEPECNYEKDKCKAYVCQTDSIITTDTSTSPITSNNLHHFTSNY